MKAVLLALVFLIGIDAVANHGAGRRSFFAGVEGFGRAIGSWVNYT